MVQLSNELWLCTVVGEGRDSRAAKARWTHRGKGHMSSVKRVLRCEGRDTLVGLVR